MTAPTGRGIGRYQLQQVIGTGAFATVHRAFDERLSDTVAVKILAENHCLNPDMRERFISEGRVLRRIDSPHVVRVHDIGETEAHQPFLILEHADRGTLAQRAADLRERGWTPGHDDIRVVARSLAAAVEALHRAEVVHRDLSPGNVLLRSTVAPPEDPASALVASDERLLLADLGLCKDLAIHSGLTAAAGTEGFRPPEQRSSAARVDARADLWALSALLVWLATGRPADDEPVAASLGRVGLPERLGAALAMSLAEDPQRRHPDVAGWLDDVEAALLPPASGALPVTSAERSSRPRTAAWLAAALVIGATLGAGAVSISGDWGDSNAVDITRLDDDRVEVAHEVGAARLAIIGPAEVTVGEVAAFEADIRDLDDWVWVMPDGTLEPNAIGVQLRTRSAGVARITLLGISRSGDRVEAVHDLRVSE